MPSDQTLSDVLEDPPISIEPRYRAGNAIAEFRAVDVDLREYSK